MPSLVDWYVTGLEGPLLLRDKIYEILQEEVNSFNEEHKEELIDFRTGKLADDSVVKRTIQSILNVGVQSVTKDTYQMDAHFAAYKM